MPPKGDDAGGGTRGPGTSPSPSPKKRQSAARPGSCGPSGRARGSSSGAPGDPGTWSDAEVQRLWQSLDRNNSGSIRVADLVKQASTLSTKCPVLLESEGLAKISREGVIRRQDFIKFLRDGVVVEKSSGGPGDVKEGEAGYSDEYLQEVWDRLAAGDGRVGMKHLVEHRDWLREKMPKLVTQFEELDTDHNHLVSFEDFRAFFGGTEAWLDHQLADIIGLQELKVQLQRFHRSVMLDRKRQAGGMALAGAGKYHMIFQGNPGTGKTSVARIMAQLLKRVGITTSDKLVEVQRPDLVAEYVGQTGPKTQKVLVDAAGGLLFIDEAYRLSSGSKNDFGREAIEQLMASMNEAPPKAPVQIYAGYAPDMAEWMKQNDGLYRRIAYTFDFEDYTCAELARILDVYVRKRGFKLHESLVGEAGEALLASIIEGNTLPRSRQLMNGGLCERIFAGAKQLLDERDDPGNPSVTLEKDDIVAACAAIPPPPEPATAKPDDAPCAPPAVAFGVPAGSAAPLPVAPAPPRPGACDRNIILKLLEGKQLRDCRHIGEKIMCDKMDPYVLVKFDGEQAYRSFKAKRGHKAPQWNEQVILSVPGTAGLLEFVVMDHNVYHKDGFIGSHTMAVSSIQPGGLPEADIPLTSKSKPAGHLRIAISWQLVYRHSL